MLYRTGAGVDALTVYPATSDIIQYSCPSRNTEHQGDRSIIQ